ncbi:MAG: L-2-hydroxyglutarate oxidase [Candidatus Melainabacteria bacterium]|nr:L-2-hydroxyglutarate oxidase [Candidatus Melainabacteria bacterium]
MHSSPPPMLAIHPAPDYVIVGAGIVGLATAYALRQAQPQARITLLEKESRLAAHGSGRNSGVVHSGLYYPPGSLKAQLCVAGSRALKQYCQEYQLPIQTVGKVIVPGKVEEDPQIDALYERGKANGVVLERIDEQSLRQLEPCVNSASGRALYVPHSAVIDPKAVVEHLAKQLQTQGVEIKLNSQVIDLQPEAGTLTLKTGERLHYGMLINAAGLFADKIYAPCVPLPQQSRYTLLPFKGLYAELTPDCPLRFNGHVYPVPDLRFPFLGIHLTKTIKGHVTLGPTALPAFGREHYGWLAGLDIRETPQMLYHVARQYWNNQHGFRAYTHAEASRFLMPALCQAAQTLAPGLRLKHLRRAAKVGIRPQLLNLQTQELVMDFVVEPGTRSVHILNAVSPALTGAFSFGEYVVKTYLGQSAQTTAAAMASSP